jgi:predicted metal-dependent peptidase
MTTTTTVEKALMRRISAARTRLISKVPFFGHLCLNLKPRIAVAGDGVPTAAVAPDGSLILNPEFCDKLSDAELCGLLCHEVMHPALLCWQRQGSRKAVLVGLDGSRVTAWNVAHDLSFNPDIVELGKKCGGDQVLKLPEGGLLEPKFAGMSAEEIYDKILEDAAKNPPRPGKCDGSCQPGQGQGQGQGQCTCPPKQGGQRIPGSKDGSGGSIGDDLRPDLSSTEQGKAAAQGDRSAQEQLDNEWRVNVVAAAQVHEQEKGKGSLPGNIQKVVDDLTDPKVDWRDALSRWVGENGRQSDYSYRRPSRRSESAGEYLPSIQRHGVDDLIILWDTSGSMNGREKDILSEVRGITEDLGISVRVICCDTRVCSDVDNIADALDAIPHIKGGGGSDFRPAFAQLDDEQVQSVVVVFTDGYIDVPATKPVHLRAVLWCLTSHDADPSNGRWGEVLRIEN